MPEPNLWNILSELGLPAIACFVICLLIWLADRFEPLLKEERRKGISDLLKERSFTSFGKLGASVVPFVFDRLFGSRVLSLKFILSSVLASCLFWLILCAVKHVNPLFIAYHNQGKGLVSTLLLLLTLFIDWVSLVKARIILKLMANYVASLWILVFVLIDLSTTYLIMLFFVELLIVGLKIVHHANKIELIQAVVTTPTKIAFAIITPFTTSRIAVVPQILAPSTMLTSAWVLLFFASVALLKLLLPLEYIRRFAVSWLDIDNQPLKVIAIVAATLVAFGALVIKAVRWGW